MWYIKFENFKNLFEFSHALVVVDECKVVLHVEVVEEWKRRVRPRPVDQRAQLKDEWREHEPVVKRER